MSPQVVSVVHKKRENSRGFNSKEVPSNSNDCQSWIQDPPDLIGQQKGLPSLSLISSSFLRDAIDVTMTAKACIRIIQLAKLIYIS